MIQLEMPNRRPISELRYVPANLGRARSRSAFSYRPLGLDLSGRSTEKKLGQSFSFLKPGFAGSLVFLAGGAAGFYFADVAPSPVSSALKGIGIAAIGWGAYSLISSFSSSSKTDLPPAPVLTPAAFDRLSGSIISPVPGSKPEQVTDGFFGSVGFNVQVIWKNESDKEATFPYDIVEYSAASPGIPVEGKTWVANIVKSSTVDKLDAGTQTHPETIFIKVIPPPEKGNEKFGKSVYYVDLQLRKISTSGAVPTGNMVRFGPFDF